MLPGETETVARGAMNGAGASASQPHVHRTATLPPLPVDVPAMPRAGGRLRTAEVPGTEPGPRLESGS